MSWRSAIAFGKFEEITNSDERAEVLNKLFRAFPMLTPVESTLALDGLAQQVIVFRIRIDRLTAVAEE
jgi:nitroimidazol reductase NimA-like FMN-containing flavoprotein (pyridoxamine 5'-phosphate oxidase superfamily)